MMPRFQSILSRIVFLHILVIGITAIVLSAAVYLLLNTTANNIQNQALREHANIIAQYLALSPEGHWDLKLPPDLAALYAHGYNGFALSVVDESGNTIFSSLADHASIFPGDSRAAEPTYFQSSYLHRTRDTPIYYGASIPEHRDDHTAWIQVAQNLEHPDVIIDDIVATFLYRVSWIVIPILLLLFAIDILIVRRAIRPVLDASASAQAIEPARLDLRLPTNNMPREILPLVNAINNALDRLEQGFRTQRDFTADAAHELRTPLTLLRTRIDTLPDQKIAGELRSDVEGMSRLVHQLLEIAELEGFTVGPDELIDLQNIASAVVAFMAPLALAQNKNIALTGEESPVWIRGNSDAVFQAIRNVVENAIRHTAHGTTVEVEIGERGSVRILDRGPGIPEKERELIFRRFWRRDRRRSGSAGLGLAIVSRIIETHAGRITVENRAEGGAAVALNFNLASARRAVG
jgi:signal transduction histidine kinase